MSFFRFEGNFFGISKVINVEKGYVGGINLNIQLGYQHLTTVDSRNVSFVRIPLFDAGNQTIMEFPAGAFSYPNGTEHQGMVQVWLTTWRTDRVDDAFTLPGDFFPAAQDDTDEGNLNGLLSAGLFCLSFGDMAFNKLSIPRASCKLTIEETNLLNIGLGSPILWGLEPELAMWQRNAQFFVTKDRISAMVQMSPRIRDFNIDWRFETCFIKIKAFKTSAFQEQIAGTRIKVLMAIVGRNRWVFSNSVVASKHGACLRVLCCKSKWCQHIKLMTILTAEDEDGDILFGADPNLGHFTGLSLNQIEDLNYRIGSNGTVNTFIEANPSGPAYPDRSQCMHSEVDYHFRFYQEEGNTTKFYIYGHVKSSPDNQMLQNVVVMVRGAEVYLGRTDGEGFYNITFSAVNRRVVIR